MAGIFREHKMKYNPVSQPRVEHSFPEQPKAFRETF